MHPASKTERNEEIRQRRRENVTLRELADEYGVSLGRIADICVGVVPKRLDPELRRQTDQEIRRLRAEGLSFQAISNHVGVTLDRAFTVARDVETPKQRENSVPA